VPVLGERTVDGRDITAGDLVFCVYYVPGYPYHWGYVTGVGGAAGTVNVAVHVSHGRKIDVEVPVGRVWSARAAMLADVMKLVYPGTDWRGVHHVLRNAPHVVAGGRHACTGDRVTASRVYPLTSDQVLTGQEGTGEYLITGAVWLDPRVFGSEAGDRREWLHLLVIGSGDSHLAAPEAVQPVPVA
jgi:hypothetical protein